MQQLLKNSYLCAIILKDKFNLIHLFHKKIFTMRKFYQTLMVLTILFMGSGIAFAQYDDLPPQPAEYGKCYAKCKIPDEYATEEKTVLVKEASSKKTSRPAEYESVTEQVLVKEASVKLVPVPAEYETITEKVLVKEASTKIVTKPPVYKTETERVMVSDGYGKWQRKKRAPSCFSQNPDDCYVMCWVEVPAKYKNVTKQVLVSPAREDVVEIPAEYKTVTRRVLRTPATVKEVEIPAEYKTVTRKVLRTPATTDEVVIPAEYKTITERRLVRTGGYTRWVEILCDQDTNSGVIRRVQQALIDRGFDPGPADGIMGSKTKSALESYQSKNGLPVGNLNTETLGSLGISY